LERGEERIPPNPIYYYNSVMNKTKCTDGYETSLWYPERFYCGIAVALFSAMRGKFRRDSASLQYLRSHSPLTNLCQQPLITALDSYLASQNSVPNTLLDLVSIQGPDVLLRLSPTPGEKCTLRTGTNKVYSVGNSGLRTGDLNPRRLTTEA